MGTRRSLSVGITVNLDNYENLRLEAGGEVENDEEVEELIAFLDRTLARFGRGSEETAERIQSFRRRVILQPQVAKQAGTAAPSATPVAPPEPRAEALAGVVQAFGGSAGKGTAVPENAGVEAAPPEGPEKAAPGGSAPPPPVAEAAGASFSSIPHAPAPAAGPAQKGAPGTAEKPVGAKEGSESYMCERCGVPITAMERKLSRLFQDRDLCKKCLSRP